MDVSQKNTTKKVFSVSDVGLGEVGYGEGGDV